MSAIELSVVLAAAGGGPSMRAALAAIQRGCDEPSTEVIVVMIDGSDPGDLSTNKFVEVRVAYRAAGTLTPVLWGAGLELSRGSIVAFTTDQMRVPPHWGRALCAAITGIVVGTAGPIDLDPDADAATAAAFFARFSSFTPERWPGASLVRDIPGDNAAYRREVVVRHRDLVREGFWEAEFHRRFERDGLELRIVPGACATLVGPVSFGTLVGQRFRHGREFGASRVTRHGASRLRLLLSAPVVPLVLLARFGRRAFAVPRNRGRFITAFPWLVVLAMWWAAGEAVGALRPRTADQR